jgi:FAD synthase
MEVEFVERIREERKFHSIPLLVAEMMRDKERARAVLESFPIRSTPS